MVVVIKWLLALLGFLCITYVIFLFVNTEIQKRKYEKSRFPCTYISGKCTIKPTYKNCLKFGHIPENVCEQRLNKRK